MESISQAWQNLGWGGILAAIGVGIVLAILLRSRKSIMRFLRESWAELGKCAWPWDPQVKGLKRYKELIDSTVIVIASSLLLAGFVTGSDFVLVKIIGFFIRMDV